MWYSNEKDALITGNENSQLKVTHEDVRNNFIIFQACPAFKRKKVILCDFLLRPMSNKITDIQFR
jgi:hypothetical protein